MANIFDIDYEKQVKALIHPDYRISKTLAYLYSIIKPLQYLRDLVLGEYKTGSAYADWSSGSTYAKYDRVIYKDNSVYESKTSSNTNNLPSGAANSSTYWRKVNNSFIGYDERISWNGQIIVFENALNRYFRTSSPNRIYIVNNNSAGIGFTIYVKLSVFNALGANNADREFRIRQFADKYTIGTGGYYAVTTY